MSGEKHLTKETRQQRQEQRQEQRQRQEDWSDSKNNNHFLFYTK